MFDAIPPDISVDLDVSDVSVDPDVSVEVGVYCNFTQHQPNFRVKVCAFRLSYLLKSFVCISNRLRASRLRGNLFEPRSDEPLGARSWGVCLA